MTLLIRVKYVCKIIHTKLLYQVYYYGRQFVLYICVKQNSNCKPSNYELWSTSANYLAIYVLMFRSQSKFKRINNKFNYERLINQWKVLKGIFRI